MLVKITYTLEFKTNAGCKLKTNEDSYTPELNTNEDYTHAGLEG